MYRFGEIESLAMMKNVCLYIRIYNEIESKANDISEIVIRDHIRAKYNKDIPLFDLAEMKRLAKSFTKEGDIPSLLQLDEIISIYIKDTEKKAKELYKSVQDLISEYETSKHSTKDGFVYSSKELSVLESPVKKQLRNNYLVLILGTLLIGIAMVAIAYPLLSKLNIDLSSSFIKNEALALIVPILSSSIVIGFIILWLILRNNINKAMNVSGLISSKIGKIRRLENSIEKSRKKLDDYIESLKVVKFKDGKLTALDKLNYLLRIDNKFVADDKDEKVAEQPKEKIAEKKAMKDTTVKEFDTKGIELSGWSKMATASAEKKNCNVDLIARIGLITDSIKANKQTDAPVFSNVIKIYCEELSTSNREKMIVKSTSQIEMYKFYISMVEKLEPYEKLCKEKFGIDYDGEKYSYRVATDEEKNDISNYAFSIIENQFSSAYFSDKFKAKVYTKYNSFKIDISKTNKRVDLYRLYIEFLGDLKSRIRNYIR